MKRIAVVSTSFVLAVAGALAQSAPPSPAGETAGAFTAAEAYAFAYCQQIAATWRQADAVGGFGGLGALPGYRGLLVQWAGERNTTAPQFIDVTSAGWHSKLAGVSGPQFASGDLLCYFVPEVAGGAARRVFCVRGDGLVAHTDNTAGTSMDGGRVPEPADVLADGGSGTLRDFPRTPGRGNDGNMWMPGDLVKQATARVMLVDEDGAGHALAAVALVPANDPKDAIDALLPAGFGRTLREGDATWTGVPARGLCLEVRAQGSTRRLPPSAVTVTGSSLRAVMKRADLKRLGTARNEAAAIATMKNISSAQAQCQASGAIDVNGNGAGEHGTFAELTGREPVRGGKPAISPPVLSTAFRKVENGVVVRNGYCFRMVLPGKDCAPVAELPGGGADAAKVDASQAETVWCLYAWPVEPGVSGQRAFFVDQSGDVLASGNDDGRYGGVAKAPALDAAREAGSDGSLAAPGAANRKGRDGQNWQVVN